MNTCYKCGKPTTDGSAECADGCQSATDQLPPATMTMVKTIIKAIAEIYAQQGAGNLDALVKIAEGPKAGQIVRICFSAEPFEGTINE